MILCQSNLLYPWGTAYMGIQIVVAAILNVRRHRKSRRRLQQTPVMTTTAANRDKNSKESEAADYNSNYNEVVLTVYRSGMMFLTFVAILAVDFPLFPRRFVKTEVHGYSLMDLGAASFVVAAGFVSPRARRPPGQRRSGPVNTVETGPLPQDMNTGSRRRRRMWRALPLLGMGLLRLLTHKGLEYPEHVSEYGVHWNFFFTLAMLTLFAGELPGPSWILPVVMLSMYQGMLSWTGLQEWVESAPRTCPPLLVQKINVRGLLCDWVAANREGILGCLGYAALYLMSEWVAFRCFWHSSGTTTPPDSGITVLMGMATLGLFATWGLLAHGFGLDVSRRTTNLLFCIWTLLVSCLQLTSIHVGTVLLQPLELADPRDTAAPIARSKIPLLPPPPIFHAVNRQGLIAFIMANLMTGVVNLSINTLQVPDVIALVILFLYLAAISAAVLVVDRVREGRRSSNGRRMPPKKQD